jgi:uncharacterized membrane protein
VGRRLRPVVALLMFLRYLAFNLRSLFTMYTAFKGEIFSLPFIDPPAAKRRVRRSRE